MAIPDSEASEPTNPLALGRAAAAQLGGDWQLDTSEETAQPIEDHSDPTMSEPLVPASGIPPSVMTRGAADDPIEEPPPTPEQLIEAMVFVGGDPLTASVACSVVRGLTPEQFRAEIEALNTRYRNQRRPYAIESRDDGFVLVVRPAYRSIRSRLFGGPRESRLNQAALDVLSVVAYRQPVGRVEIDTIRGTDSAATLRQLVRLGLIAIRRRGDAADQEVRYGTTPRFLQVFGLSSLDELPRLGDSLQM
jgi:segregation and condensation protein B